MIILCLLRNSYEMYILIDNSIMYRIISRISILYFQLKFIPGRARVHVSIEERHRANTIRTKWLSTKQINSTTHSHNLDLEA